MAALTHSTPKPLVKVLDKPLIEYHLDKLQSAGFSTVVINVSWLAEQLENYFNNLYKGSLYIKLYSEPQALETGGGVFSALEDLSDDGTPFLVINADVMSDFDFASVPTTMKSLAHLYMVDNPLHNPLGDFYLDNQGGLRLDSSKNTQAKLTFSGISLLSPQLFSGCEIAKFSLVNLFRKYMAQGLVSGEKIHNTWIDVGTVERLEQASEWQRTLR